MDQFQLNPDVEKYLMEKYGADYSKKSEKAYDDAKDRIATGQFISGIGSALAGRAPSQTSYYNELRKQAKADTIDKIKDDSDKYVYNQLQNLQLAKAQDESRSMAEKNDLNSSVTKNYQMLAKQFVPGLDVTSMTASQLEKQIPSLEKLYSVKAASEQKGLDNDIKRMTAMATIEDKKLKSEERERKEGELSATQAKQMGLYNIGKEAEAQFNAAMGKPGYDPTSYTQLIDNTSWMPNLLRNNAAIESEAAQSAWVEAFLRDASGAAIPPSERLAYAKDFFPRKGDSPETVANKATLRQQKMENALLGAGQQGQAELARIKGLTDTKQIAGNQPDKVKVKKGDQVFVIPKEDLQAAMADGFTEVGTSGVAMTTPTKK